MNYISDIKNYSTYSCELGMIPVADIVDNSVVQKSKVAFLTDHSTLSGVPEFVDQCEKQGVKPVIGLVINLYDNKEFDDQGEITLYAQNQIGYDNLKKIVSNLEKVQDRYLFDESLFEKYNQGLVAVTGGFNSKLYKEGQAENFSHLENLKHLFGKDNVFLELQKRKKNDTEEFETSLKNIQDKELSIILSNENRFTNKAHFNLMIEKGKRALGVNSDHSVLEKIMPEDFTRTQNQIFGFYYKNNHDAITATNQFAQQFESVNVLHNDVIMPKANQNQTLREVLRDKYSAFIKDIEPEKRPVYKERIQQELSIIEELGFDDYFLIFDDITKSNKDQVGFALRGSSVGSLVVHMLGISDVDPVENDLLFERFLNRGRGERHELPDIDLETTDTSHIFNYISQKYGSDNVAMLMTHDSVKSKTQLALAYDVMKNHYVSYLDNNFEKDFNTTKSAIDKNYGSQGRSISEELEQNKYLKKLVATNKNVEKIINLAKVFDNQVLRNKRGNAGIVINNDDISDVFSIKKDDNFVVNNIIEAEKDYIERLGLIKLDVLSNKYLEKTLKAYSDINLDWNEKGKRYQSPEVYNLLSEGHTVSINQLKNPKQAQLCKEVGIDNFSDLTAVVALLRPGVDPKDRDNFINNKSNPDNVDYVHPLMEDILSETYGVVVYDEQIMKIVQKIGDFSPEQSDDFRSAIKKNKLEQVREYKDQFLSNALNKEGMDQFKANKIYDSLENITGKYTFTKAHATVYSDLIYKQTWLKANYPNEYIKHFLMDNQNELDEYIDELSQRDIKVMNVSVNRTGYDYETLHKNGKVGVDFSLGHVFKNEKEFAKAIVKEREENGNFKNIFDYIERVMPRYSGLSLLSPQWHDNEQVKNTFVNNTQKLIKAGGFDNLVPKEMDVKLVDAREMLTKSLKEGVENALKPYIPSDYEYTFPEENTLELDKVIKDEKSIYGASLTQKRMDKEAPKKKNRP